MDKNSAAALYKKMQTEVEAYQGLQKSCVKVVKQRAMLESQLNENKCVLDELNLLGADNKVYKLFGPVLVKQELEDSRQNVGKRIEYISKELNSSNNTLESMEKDMHKHREAVSKYQQQWQVAAAMK
ncbi:CG7770 [Drosophila busckii]|uniref:Probable prefoldin subunit 6 n=1 Tax=Drosophila busckii TaxID=30019 RepID=A0A0M3QWR6_DROBS|nr:probable prefoldin subunit 6 [Drosophila busckii]ALC44643.1 CG7770 [Drosophila busckii]